GILVGPESFRETRAHNRHSLRLETVARSEHTPRSQRHTDDVEVLRADAIHRRAKLTGAAVELEALLLLFKELEYRRETDGLRGTRQHFVFQLHSESRPRRRGWRD